MSESRFESFVRQPQRFEGMPDWLSPITPEVTPSTVVVGERVTVRMGTREVTGKVTDASTESFTVAIDGPWYESP